MNAPRLAGDGVAQAVYTWSRKRLDGTVGMGFFAISSSLVGSIDWLGRLNPAEFDLFQGDVTGLPDKLYEARRGFSEVGRMLADDVAIVYCKTADGENGQASGRPHQVVHTLIGDPATLGLSCVTRVRDDFWIRKVDGSASDLGLTDLTIADILEAQDAPAGHSCPGDHPGAEGLLRVVAAGKFEREGTIELPDGDGALAPVTLAFPEEVTNRFSLVPYVVIGGVRRELVLRVPAAPAPPRCRDGQRPGARWNARSIRRPASSSTARPPASAGTLRRSSSRTGGPPRHPRGRPSSGPPQRPRHRGSTRCTP